MAQPGDVLVIDAGGVAPGLWGELATNSAIQRGLAGVVIYGAARDTGDIRQLWASRSSPRSVTPTAGEPKGFGEIGVPIRIAGVSVSPGDWIIGDDDGVCVIPKEKAVEYTNRAMDVLEKENRLREEIQARQHAQPGGATCSSGRSSRRRLLCWAAHATSRQNHRDEPPPPGCRPPPPRVGPVSRPGDLPPDPPAGGQARPPAEKALWRRVVRQVVLLGISAVGLYVVWPSLLQVFSAWPDLRDVDPVWFLVMVVFEAMSFACMWILIRLALQEKEYFLVGTSQLAGNALSRILPGGAATGGALQYRMLTEGGVNGARTATGLTAVSLLTFGTLFALPLLSLPGILTGVPVNNGLFRTAVVGLVMFVLAAGVGAALLTFDRPLMLGGRMFQVVRRFVRRRADSSDLPQRLLAERDLIRKVLGQQWVKALLASIGKSMFDFLALLMALTAVGARPYPSLVLIAYVVAALLAMVPITPGGLGFVEAGLVATLGLAGVSAGDASLATLAYRLVSYWLPLPAGLAAYALYRRRYPANGRAAQTTHVP